MFREKNPPVSVKRNTVNLSCAEIPKLRVLERDTVSFGCKNKIPGQLRNIAGQIKSKAEQTFLSFDQMCRRICGGAFACARVKLEPSIESKLKKIPTHPLKTLSVNKARNMVKATVTDFFGARGIIDGSEKSADKIIEKLCTEIEAGNITVTTIRDYHGQLWSLGKKPTLLSKIKSYLPMSRAGKIMEAQEKINPNVSIRFESRIGKLSPGYTSAHILGETKQGIPFELQIKGNRVSSVDIATHMLHDFDKKKLNPKYSDTSEKREVIGGIKELYETLTPEQKSGYDKYIFKCYNAARKAETAGGNLELPKIPDSMPFKRFSSLSIGNLRDTALKYGLR